MRTTCPSCGTSYTVPEARIGAKGRKVRCTRCGEEWRAVLPLAAEEAIVPPAPPPLAPPTDAAGATDAIAPAAFEHDAAFDDAFDADTAPAPLAEPETAASPPAAAPDAAALPPHPVHPVEVHHGPRLVRRHHRMAEATRHLLSAAAVRLAPLVGPAVFLAACLVVTLVYVERRWIVARAPGLAGLYAALGAPVNLRGLTFGRIETLREVDNGQPVLVVEGSITNVSRQLREVPALRFALRGVDTQELYAWSIDPRSITIESGDTIRFRTRLAAPPDQATDVQVRFVERRSRQAGLP